MLAERRITPTTPVALALLAPLLLSVLLAFAGTSRGDFIGVTTNSDASRTAIWNMNSSAGLNQSGIAFNARHAELPWVTNNVSWSNAADLASNGTLDANTTSLAGGIGLLADDSNHVANAGFDTGSVWNYGNGTAQRLNATWNGTVRAGMFHYGSPSTQALWASMDSPSGWIPVASLDTTSVPTANTTEKMQGAASVEMEVSFVGTNGNYASLQNASIPPVDWSSANRLVLWVYMNATAPVTFNISAADSSFITHYTSAQQLVRGWEEITVDLDQLGTASVRAQLHQISLRASSTSTVSRTLLFDDIRLGTAKEFSDVAFISQSVAKVNGTSSAMGSAHIGLRWWPANSSNLTSSGVVSVSGPGGSYQHSLPTTPAGSWSSFAADVSSTTGVAGTYTINVSVTVFSNTTAPSHLTLFLDNVSLYFPNRHNGTYVSDPVSLGNDSVFDSVSWSAALPPAASAELSLRIQRNSPLPGTWWGPWSSWPSPGSEPLNGLTGLGFQARVTLNTTNASVSPVLESLTVTTHHRAPRGTLGSGPLTVTDLNFLCWRNVTVIMSQPAATAIQFYVGNGTDWTSVTLGQYLKYVYTSPTIYWRADFVTLDTLSTPTLSQVNLTYEYRGPPVRISIYPAGPVNVTSGRYVTFDAYAWDAGNHPVEVAYYEWHTTDPTGSVFQNNGTYHAGTPGNYTVTANLPGDPTIFAKVLVRVLPANGNSTGPTNTSRPIDLGPWWPFLLAIAAIGGGGFVVYEVVIRRLFSIEDVFLISKDGRLMMHNTRRMRADRDEDILSGMLTAIMSFLRDQDPEENGELKQFKVGGKTTMLERGRHAYLAAVYTGRVPRWAAKDLHRFMEDLDAHFGDAFRTWKGAPDDLQDLKAFTLRFARNVRYRRGLFRERAS